MVRLLERERQRPVLDPTAIDEEDESLPVRPRDRRRPDPPGHRDSGHRRGRFERLKRNRRLTHLQPKRPRRRGNRVAGPVGCERPPAVDGQRPGHGRIGGGIGLGRPSDVSRFGARLPQEFAPRRHIAEEVAHRHRRANRRGNRPRSPRLPELDLHHGTGRGVALTGANRQRRNGADTRQRLAAKPEGPQPVEVVEGRQLRRRVPLHRQWQLGRRDPAAIVGDLDQVDPAAGDLDLQPGRSRVERVLDQFFRGRRRAFDDLAGRNLPDRVAGKETDTHRWESRSLAGREIDQSRAGCYHSGVPGITVAGPCLAGAPRQTGYPSQRSAKARQRPGLSRSGR